MEEIAVMCGGTMVNSHDSALTIQGVVTDSRKITDGCLFVPLVGERFDGHDFAADCLAHGAAACLWEESKGTPPGPAVMVKNTLEALQSLAKCYLQACRAKVIGITGSNGKTTTKDLVFSLLSTTYKVHKTQGNFNNHIGLPLTVLAMPEDTEICVLEMGMSGRHEIELLSDIAEPETVIVTNIGESHLLQLGSREEIARAKLEILSGLTTGGLFIYNGDEPLIVSVLAESGTKKPDKMRTATFGLGHQNDDYPVVLTIGNNKTIFQARSLGDVQLELPLLGEHNVVNALAALTVARHYGVNTENIKEGLNRTVLTGMRIEVITGVSGITILNDAYNASPTSMKAAIGVLASMKGYRRKYAVLGDMLELGEEEEAYHLNIGKSIPSDAMDQLFTFGTLGDKIAEGASHVLGPENVHAFSGKQELIQQLITVLHPNDVLLVKASRGMKLEEVVEAVRTSEFSR